MDLARLVVPSLGGFIALGCLMPAAQAAPAPAPLAIPLTAERWQTSGKVDFVSAEGFPLGLLKVAEGSALARGLTFDDGTIEYDTKLLDDSFAAIRFRRRDPDTAEIFYLRPDPDCPAANDCVQYVPRVHGVWPWEMYPEYQASAPLSVGRRRIRRHATGAWFATGTSPTRAGSPPASRPI